MAKKDKKQKLVPKKVGGVKVPKKLRKSGDTLASLVTSPIVRELAADMLIAMAGALVASKRPRETAATMAHNVSRAGSAAVDMGADAASAAKDTAQTATGAVAGVVGEAAKRILPSSVTGEDGKKFAGMAGEGRKRKNPDKGREH
jgi:hypothetical protein